MQRPVVFGNWKMHTSRAEARALAEGVRKALGDGAAGEAGVCPPFVYLRDVLEVLQGSPVRVGAQNCHWETQGAFTGEVSATMLRDLGCTHVILGHSERRHGLGETDDIVRKKLAAAWKAGLTPIFCVGETLAEREAGKTSDIVRRHVTEGLRDARREDLNRLIIAYEPVWAIGTGRTATPAQAQEVHNLIRRILTELPAAGAETARAIPLQYGGSVKPDNVAEIAAQPDVDGALVGGASLKVEDFVKIVRGAARTK